MLTLRPTLSAAGSTLARAARSRQAAALVAALLVQCAAGCGGASTAPAEAPPKAPEATSTAAPTSSSAPDADGSKLPQEKESASDAKKAELSRSFSTEGGDGSSNDAAGQGAPPPPPPAPSSRPITSGAPGGFGSADGRGKGGGVERAVAGSSTTPLSGRLTQKDIGDILSANSALFNDCYTIGAGSGQSFTGVVTVRATLGPTGTVNEAVVTKSTAQNAKVDACVAAAFKKIKFPKPVDGATSVITFPMQFNGAEQVQ